MGRSMALLTMEQCKDVMADCMADDVGLRWPEMQSWPIPIIFSTNLFLWFHDDWFYMKFVMIAVGFLGKEFVR